MSCKTAGERADPAIHPADGIMGDPHCLDGGTDGAGSGVVTSVDLSVCCGDHQ
jgi:hypothetical protein